MGTQRALGRRPRSSETLDTDLVALVDRLTRRLRKAHRVCRTVTIRLRFDDSSRATRSHTLPEATARILSTARGLLASAMPMIRCQGITLIGVTLTNLHDDGAIQLALPFDRPLTQEIDDTIDGVRERFGSAAITRAVLLGRNQGPSVPLLQPGGSRSGQVSNDSSTASTS